jgi:uncharacterized protein (DUF58 family)
MSWLSRRMSSLPPGRIYVIPTRYGFVMAVSFAVMFITSSAFGNNIAYLLTFLVFSIGLLSLVYAHVNLVGIRINKIEDDPAPPDAEGHLILEVTKQRGAANLITLHIQTDDEEFSSEPVDVESGDHNRTSLAYRYKNRGVYEIKNLRLESTFPMGLFRAWVVCGEVGSCHVHPKVTGSLPLPVTDHREGESLESTGSDGWDDFGGHVAYVVGQSQKSLDWKASARARTKLSKKFVGGLENTVVFRWDDVATLPKEAALSQLASWIIACDSRGIAFGLEMPNGRSGIGTGRLHLTDCLKLLAEA